MTPLIQAIDNLQRKVIELSGGREYRIEKLTNKEKNSRNILQAAWNVLATLRNGLESNWPFVMYMTPQLIALWGWMDYLNNADGSYRIIDETTYQLGITILPILGNAMNDDNITSIAPLSTLKASQAILEKQLREYELKYKTTATVIPEIIPEASPSLAQSAITDATDILDGALAATGPEAMVDIRISSLARLKSQIASLSNDLSAISERQCSAETHLSGLRRPNKDLPSMIETARIRRGMITEHILHLNAYSEGLTNGTVPTNPTDLLAKLEFIEETDIERIRQLLASTADTLRARAEIKKTPLGMIAVHFHKNDTNALTELQLIIRTKIAELRSEFLINDIRIAPALDAPRGRLWYSLYELQHDYKARLTWETKKQHLELIQLNAQHITLRLHQAQLRLLLTQLEFNLADIKPKAETLSAVLPGMASDHRTQTLALVAQHKDTIDSLDAWFNASTSEKTNDTLYKELLSLNQSIESYYQQLTALHSVANPMPADCIEEMHQLRDKTATIHEQFTHLKELKNTIATRVIQLAPIKAFNELKDLFFGNDPSSIGGLFGQYLAERAITYRILDIFEHCVSYLMAWFGCNTKTDAYKRKEYIQDLQIAANAMDVATFKTTLQRGITLFSARRAHPELSLNNQLKGLQHRLDHITSAANT